jgi:hypothetical protein
MEILNIQPDTTERMASKSQSNEWILDNGASNHMTWTLEIMRELHDMQTCPIGLPDGKNASATEEGVVLYYFRTIERVQTCSVVGVNRLELWHRRQGHSSLKVTQLVLGTSKNIDHVELNEKL